MLNEIANVLGFVFLANKTIEQFRWPNQGTVERASHLYDLFTRW